MGMALVLCPAAYAEPGDHEDAFDLFGPVRRVLGREQAPEKPREPKRVPTRPQFSPEKRDFDPSNSAVYAWLSYLAYLKKGPTGSPDMEAIAAQMAGWGGELIPIDASPVQGFIWRTDKFAVVILRGSDEWKDWVDNGKAVFPGSGRGQPRAMGRPAILRAAQEKKKQIPLPHHDLHAGFYRQFLLAHDQVFEALKGYEGKPVRFAGHSLGGALSTLFARDAHRGHGIRDVTLHTYGAPRPGSKRLAEYFGKTDEQGVYRHNHVPAYATVFNNDPVPSVPDDLRFESVGLPVYVDADGKSGPLPKLRGFNKDDHSMAGYVDTVMNLVPIPLRR